MVYYYILILTSLVKMKYEGREVTGSLDQEVSFELTVNFRVT